MLPQLRLTQSMIFGLKTSKKINIFLVPALCSQQYALQIFLDITIFRTLLASSCSYCPLLNTMQTASSNWLISSQCQSHPSIDNYCESKDNPNRRRECQYTKIQYFEIRPPTICIFDYTVHHPFLHTNFGLANHHKFAQLTANKIQANSLSAMWFLRSW